jgi:UDP-3-O-[3-hydroxymyristoyl] glucosamine N-acyltransferase
MSGPDGVMRLSSLPRTLGLRVHHDASFADLGLLSHARPGELIYIRDARVLKGARPLTELSVIAPPDLEGQVASGGLALADDPEAAFYAVHEHLATSTAFYWKDFATEIDPSARVHERAYVAPQNVRIGPKVVIEPHATILERVSIGEGSIIRAGAVLGAEGFEFKARALRQHRAGVTVPEYAGVRSVTHAGSVVLGKRVEIQANAALDRGLFRRPTQVGDDSKIDNLVHIAHSAEIGERCLVVAGAVIAGSVSIGDDVWIGPGAIISNGVRIGDRASVVLGTTVVRDVPSDARVSADLRVFRL